MTRLLIRWVLRLAPREFRARYEAELLGVHAARSGGGRGVIGRAAFNVREVLGAAAVGLRLRLGSTGTSKGMTRGGASMFETGWQDLHYGVRTLLRHRGFSLAALVVLALGIGANTAVFSAVNAYFYRPLPFASPDRLVMIYETNPEFGWTDAQVAPANFLDWREQVDAFSDVAAYTDFFNQVTTIQHGQPVLVGTVSVTGNFFETLGVPAAMGRTFRMEETWGGGDLSVVMSHDLWVSRYGADPDIVGKSVQFPAGAAEIIGVMPAGFRFPSEETGLWITARWDLESRDQVWFRRAHMVRAIGRIRDGVSHEEAAARLQVVVSRLQEEYPETNSVMGAGFMPLHDYLVRGVRTPLLVLLGAVTLLLLLACTNVANLMLVRASDRTREIALRQALGAARTRVARQLATESALLALVGGALGLALGWMAVRAIGASQPIGIDGATSLALDYRVVLFTLAAAGLSGVLFGTGPVLRATSGDVRSSLHEGHRSVTLGRAGLRSAGALVTIEVALALTLVVGAGLMVRSFLLLRQVDPGFRAEGVLAVDVSVPAARYPNRDQVLAFWDQFAEALEARPGIDRVGTVGRLPLSGASWSSQFQAEGWPPERVGFEILHRRADRGYFEALQIPLVRGRMFEPTDQADGPLVVLINETFAREYFPGEDPIGQRIAYDRAATAESTWYEIIGVVGDQQQGTLGEPARAEAFENRNQDWARSVSVVIRGDGDPTSFVPMVRNVLHDMDSLIPLANVRSLSQVRRASMAREEFILSLLGAFGLVALLLASVGVYGVTAQAARKRTHEIGIRMALGASARSVLRMMLRQGFTVVGVGLAIGLAASYATTRALTSLLYEVEPTDPITLASVVALLGTVALVATYVPARRASGVDPVRSLRTE